MIARLLALSLTALVLTAQPMSHAFADTPNLREASIIVSGEGDASIAPDIAILHMSVNKIGKNAGRAMSENAKAMNVVLEALKKQGIADKDLRTSGFSIVPQFFYPQNNSNGTQGIPELTGYQVVNSITVRLRDISRVGEILDQSVELGINQGAGVTFANDNPKATIEAARREAVKNAIAKANILAEAAGVKLGRIIDISDTNSQPALMGTTEVDFKLAQRAAPTPIAAGENTYQITVTMTFAINQ